jgi:hypothetical protein
VAKWVRGNEIEAPLVRQLLVTNHNLGGGLIIMLTKNDKQKVEDEIKTHQLDLMGKNVQKIRMFVCLL